MMKVETTPDISVKIMKEAGGIWKLKVKKCVFIDRAWRTDKLANVPIDMLVKRPADQIGIKFIRVFRSSTSSTVHVFHDGGGVSRWLVLSVSLGFNAARFRNLYNIKKDRPKWGFKTIIK